MSAAELREAAALMRERAEAAAEYRDAHTGAPLPWHGTAGAVYDSGAAPIAATADGAKSLHIASWHPAAALAVADWLENAAEDLAMQGPNGELRKNWDMRVHIAGDKALAVARAYLGSVA